MHVRFKSLRWAVFGILGLALSMACGGGGGTASTPTPTPPVGLLVTITGLTPLAADVTVTGPGSYSQHLTATQTLTGLTDGSYTITAATVTDTNHIGLGREHGGTLGAANLQRYPLRPVQTVAVSGGAATATVDYPVATLTVQIPKTGISGETVPMDFVLMPAGSFSMGSNEANDSYYLDAKPPHPVNFSEAFYMAKTELTQAQWMAVMGATNNPSYFKGDTRPVDMVDWNMIRKSTPSYTCFLDQLNAVLPDLGFRLPSEAEWEYVCRAGTTTTYFFGADTTNAHTYAVLQAISTDSVASKAPNHWGLYDIVGNMWEWNEDDSHVGYSGAPTNGSAWVDSSRGSNRMLRGGCYKDAADVFSSALRLPWRCDSKADDTGFRVVMPVPGTH